MPRNVSNEIQLDFKTQELDPFHRLLLAPGSVGATVLQAEGWVPHADVESWASGVRPPGSEPKLLVLLAAGP